MQRGRFGLLKGTGCTTPLKEPHRQQVAGGDETRFEFMFHDIRSYLRYIYAEKEQIRFCKPN